MNKQDVRWVQRFDNFKRVYALLCEVLDGDKDVLSLSTLEKEGTIQRFENTFELAWKTLKDKMEYDGVSFEQISPKYVFKLGYNHKYINNIERWIEMTNDRNLLAHTYNFVTFDKVLENIAKEYHPLPEQLFTYFSKEQNN